MDSLAPETHIRIPLTGYEVRSTGQYGAQGGKRHTNPVSDQACSLGLKPVLSLGRQQCHEERHRGDLGA